MSAGTAVSGKKPFAHLPDVVAEIGIAHVLGRAGADPVDSSSCLHRHGQANHRGSLTDSLMVATLHGTDS